MYCVREKRISCRGEFNCWSRDLIELTLRAVIRLRRIKNKYLILGNRYTSVLFAIQLKLIYIKMLSYTAEFDPLLCHLINREPKWYLILNFQLTPNTFTYFIRGKITPVSHVLHLHGGIPALLYDSINRATKKYLNLGNHGTSTLFAIKLRCSRRPTYCTCIKMISHAEEFRCF